MGFFRSAEIKNAALTVVLVTAAASVIGFMLGLYYGLFALLLSAAINTVYFYITYQRYRRIAALSNMIDNILHYGGGVDFAEYGEGELAVLSNEISKMTLRMREQADALKKDKTFLTDSIADISHQLRTPLTSMNLIISFLAKPNRSEERRMELVRELSSLTGKIDWLVSSLLKLSKLDSGTVEFAHDRILLCEVVKKAYDPLAIPMELREQTFVINSCGGESFTGDLPWTTEAVGNILKNCMEHTPVGGRITVNCCENPVYSEITVTDTGKGIDKDDLPHLFERFYKGKNASENSVGIGLALAKLIAIRQNGTIKAENNPDGGAKFTLRFYKSVV